ncbi:MAG: hypothetical protein JXA46_12855 [Dehalococcoidales bacterium]|nr:hypothetical protein [Dehalococcoidales bacterium]
MIRRKTRLILGSMTAVLAVPAILGLVCNLYCADYRVIGGMIREGSALLPPALTRMPFSTLFEIMLLCAIVAIGGIAAGLYFMRRPGCGVKVESKTGYPVNKK